MVYVFASSLVGMISGSVVAYFGAVLLFEILNRATNIQLACGEGMFFGVVLIISGAILGSVSGSAVAIKHPLGKSA